MENEIVNPSDVAEDNSETRLIMLIEDQRKLTVEELQGIYRAPVPSNSL